MMLTLDVAGRVQGWVQPRCRRQSIALDTEGTDDGDRSEGVCKAAGTVVYAAIMMSERGVVDSLGLGKATIAAGLRIASET